MLSHKKSLDKIESLHKRALRFLLNDYVSSYEQLLEKSGKCNMNIRRLRFLCTEIHKTLNVLNPSFTKEIFENRNENRVTQDMCRLNHFCRFRLAVQISCNASLFISYNSCKFDRH